MERSMNKKQFEEILAELIQSNKKITKPVINEIGMNRGFKKSDNIFGFLRQAEMSGKIKMIKQGKGPNPSVFISSETDEESISSDSESQPNLTYEELFFRICKTYDIEDKFDVIDVLHNIDGFNNSKHVGNVIYTYRKKGMIEVGDTTQSGRAFNYVLTEEAIKFYNEKMVGKLENNGFEKFKPEPSIPKEQIDIISEDDVKESSEEDGKFISNENLKLAELIGIGLLGKVAHAEKMESELIKVRQELNSLKSIRKKNAEYIDELAQLNTVITKYRDQVRSLESKLEAFEKLKPKIEELENKDAEIDMLNEEIERLKPFEQNTIDMVASFRALEEKGVTIDEHGEVKINFKF